MSADPSRPATYPWRAGQYGHHRYLWPALQQLLPAQAGLTVLDAGCGNGYLAAKLTEMGHSVTGIDSSPEGIDRARSLSSGARFAVASVYDDLSALSPSGGWDVAIAVEVIEHLWAPGEFLANMSRSLKSGGVLIVTTPHHGYVKNLAISVVNGWDRHFAVHNTGGHIKFFSRRTLSRMLRNHHLEPEAFAFAGRMPLLRKSMVCRARHIPPLIGQDR